MIHVYTVYKLYPIFIVAFIVVVFDGTATYNSQTGLYH